MQRQREMGAWWEMKKKQAMEEAHIPDHPLTGDPFADLEQQAAQLPALVASGQPSQARLEALLAEVRLQDEQGRWWMVDAGGRQDVGSSGNTSRAVRVTPVFGSCPGA